MSAVAEIKADDNQLSHALDVHQYTEQNSLSESHSEYSETVARTPRSSTESDVDQKLLTENDNYFSRREDSSCDSSQHNDSFDHTNMSSGSLNGLDNSSIFIQQSDSEEATPSKRHASEENVVQRSTNKVNNNNNNNGPTVYHGKGNKEPLVCTWPGCPRAESKKPFNRKYLLEDHMRMHKHIYDFVCPVCQKAFTSRDYLKRHIQTHSKPTKGGQIRSSEESSNKVAPIRGKAATGIHVCLFCVERPVFPDTVTYRKHLTAFHPKDRHQTVGLDGVLVTTPDINSISSQQTLLDGSSRSLLLPRESLTNQTSMLLTAMPPQQLLVKCPPQNYTSPQANIIPANQSVQHQQQIYSTGVSNPYMIPSNGTIPQIYATSTPYMEQQTTYYEQSTWSVGPGPYAGMLEPGFSFTRLLTEDDTNSNYTDTHSISPMCSMHPSYLTGPYA